ncbi:MAG: hypothetical protein V4717_11800 [Bacteroidota bacterium]
MRTLLSSIFIIALVLSMFSCKKETVFKSRTELLTQKRWIQTYGEIGIRGVYTSDWADYKPCKKDDNTTLKVDKTYQMSEGPTKCNPNDPDVYDTGTWEFSANESKITIGRNLYNIKTLDENKMVLVYDGFTTYRLTYGH